MSARLIAALIMAAVLAGFGCWAYNAGKRSVQADWDAERSESARLVRQQQDANRGAARVAEIRYVDRQTVQTVFLNTTEKELQNEAKNLDACRLDAGDLSLLQRAASCAREDRSATCGAGEQMPAPR